MVVDIWGRTFGGRPRRPGALANFSGQPSFERSGAVSGPIPQAVEPSFSFIGLPHPDDPVYVVAAGPDEYHHRFVQKADGVSSCDAGKTPGKSEPPGPLSHFVG